VRSQSGQATIEFTAMLVWLAIAALFAWQIGLAAWAYVSATNAARTAARVYSRTGDQQAAEDVAKQSVSGVLASNPDVHFQGEKAVVHVSIPILIPRLPSGLQAEGDAEMPNTG
jgi:Flp pilus assembly protein TadG